MDILNTYNNLNKKDICAPHITPSSTGCFDRKALERIANGYNENNRDKIIFNRNTPDKKLWDIIDENGDLNDPNNYQKRWIGDSKDQQKEIYRLFLYGENDNFSLNNKEKSIDEFYESIGLFNMWSKIRSNINLQNS